VRHLRLDGPLVAELQAPLSAMPVDREELRGSLGCHPERAQRVENLHLQECETASGDLRPRPSRIPSTT
jgi:hypothetical protein